MMEKSTVNFLWIAGTMAILGWLIPWAIWGRIKQPYARFLAAVVGSVLILILVLIGAVLAATFFVVVGGAEILQEAASHPDELAAFFLEAGLETSAFWLATLVITVATLAIRDGRRRR